RSGCRSARLRFSAHSDALMNAARFAAHASFSASDATAPSAGAGVDVRDGSIVQPAPEEVRHLRPALVLLGRGGGTRQVKAVVELHPVEVEAGPDEVAEQLGGAEDAAVVGEERNGDGNRDRPQRPWRPDDEQRAPETHA